MSSLLLSYPVDTPDFTVIQIKLVFFSLHVGCVLWNLATQPESLLQTTLPALRATLFADENGWNGSQEEEIHFLFLLHLDP